MGILTDRDIVISVLAKDVEHMSALAVKDVMTTDLVVALEDEDAEAVLARMQKRGIRRGPVLDREGSLIGVFALDDVLHQLASDLAKMVALVARQRHREQSRRP